MVSLFNFLAVRCLAWVDRGMPIYIYIYYIYVSWRLGISRFKASIQLACSPLTRTGKLKACMCMHRMVLIL